MKYVRKKVNNRILMAQQQFMVGLRLRRSRSLRSWIPRWSCPSPRCPPPRLRRWAQPPRSRLTWRPPARRWSPTGQLSCRGVGTQLQSGDTDRTEPKTVPSGLQRSAHPLLPFAVGSVPLTRGSALIRSPVFPPTSPASPSRARTRWDFTSKMVSV